MKKYSYLLFMFTFFVFTSCLTGGLEDLPEFEENEIIGIQRVEYRYISNEVSNASGQQIVKKVELGRSNITVNSEAATVSLDVTVPAANEASFPVAEREKCSLSNIGVMVTISTAARISPKDGAPALGVPGDWSKPNKYIVTAANGDQREWTISIANFVK